MKKVLIVEDNEKNMYLASFIINNMGYKVIQAKTGMEGIEMAVREKPDLILMDIQLPDIDGLEAARRIRESHDDNSMMIIAVTSFAMSGDREKILSTGCNGYIEKPIVPESFMKEIEKFLCRND